MLTARAHLRRALAAVGIAALALLGALAFPQAAAAAPYSVTNLNDAGAGSLRAAVLLANASPGEDTIFINVAGTITLASTITVVDGLRIEGFPVAGTTITRSFSGDVFVVDMGAGVLVPDRIFTMNLVKMQGVPATYTGRAVHVLATQLLDTFGLYNSYFFGFGGPTLGRGGAVYVEGLSGGFTADNTDFTNNTAPDNASANDGGGTVHLLNVAGPIQFTSVLLQASSAARGGGVMINSPLATVTLTDAQIAASTAINDAGGGIYVAGAAEVTLQSSILTSNDSVNAGAGLAAFGSFPTTIIDSQITFNDATGNGGGGVYVNGGVLSITDSVFSFNTATGPGGGLAAAPFGSMTSVRISGSDFHDNTAQNGGGIFVGTYTAVSWITNSTFTDNVAKSTAALGGFGGAINFGITNGGIAAPFTITASTFTHNDAYRITGGGVKDAPGRGGAIYTKGAIDNFLIEDSLFTQNDLGGYAGNFGVSIFVGADQIESFFDIVNTTFVEPVVSMAIYLDGIAAGGEFVVSHSTFSTDLALAINDNTAGGVARASHVIFDAGPAFETIYVDSGDPVAVDWSLFRSTAAVVPSAAATNSLFSVPSVMLGPLQNNGGPTLTRMPQPGSTAIDRGNPAAVLLPAYDQREVGFDRVINNIVDIGAVEAPYTLAPTGATINPIIPIGGAVLLLLGVGLILWRRLSSR